MISPKLIGTGLVLLILVLLGLSIVGRLALGRRQAAWQARTDSLLTTQREEWVAVTGRLQTALGQERRRGDSLHAVTLRLVDQYARSAAATRTVLAQIPTGLALDTLPAEACRALLTNVVSSCETSLARADSAIAAGAVELRTADRRAVLADSLAGIHRARALTLEDQLRIAPIGEPKWFGFLPRPRFVVGLGCAGGLKFGCGLSGTLGFTF